MPDSNLNRRIIFIAGGAVIVIALIAAVFMNAGHKNQPKPTPSVIPPGNTVDKNNGETISNPAGQVPEQGAGSGPTFTGMNTMRDDGTTAYQVTNLEKAFVAFKKDAQLFSIVSSSIVIHMQDNNGNQITTFSVQVDNGPYYNAQLINSSISASRLILTDPKTNAQVFDSGVIDSYTDTND